jgi:hypothetical protein
MRMFYDRSVAIVLFAALAAVLIARGIVPAMSKIDSDFPGYFTAAKIVADGGPVERLYDDVWFQQQMRRYNFRAQRIGKFSPFPPPTALLLLPLARMEPLNALRVVTVASALCLAVSVVLLARILSLTWVESTAFILVVKASIMLAALATLIKLARSGIAAAAVPSIGILGILTLLEAPATATYHFVLRETPTLDLSPS